MSARCQAVQRGGQGCAAPAVAILASGPQEGRRVCTHHRALAVSFGWAARDFVEPVNEAMARNNPRNEPTGHFTGRCSKCGSTDLWDDNLHYGCNACGAILL